MNYLKGNSSMHSHQLKSVEIRILPTKEEIVAAREKKFKYGKKVFKMNQVDKLPEPKDGIDNFIRTIALDTEKDPSLNSDDLPKKIEFKFEVDLDGNLSGLNLTSKVNGSEKTQDKIYKLLRQIHKNIIQTRSRYWEPGMKNGSPVVTKMTIEIPRKYLF
jgi:hypothetical protein